MTNTLEAGAGGAGFREFRPRPPAAHDALSAFVAAHESAPRRPRFARVFGVDSLDELTWPLYQRAVGTLETARLIGRLDDDWSVVDDVRVDGSPLRIDHLLIGPAGVFTISTLDQSDQSVWIARAAFELAGPSHNHIRNSALEVGFVERRLSELLGVPVEASGIVVASDPAPALLPDDPRDVTLVRPKDLLTVLRARPVVLSPERVDAIADAAHAAFASRGDLPSEARASDVLRHFTAASRELTHARTIRRLWVVAIFAAFAGVFAFAAWGLLMASGSGVIGA